MKMKSRFLGAVELEGQITDLRIEKNWMIMTLKTTTPAGLDLKAAMTHDDLVTLIKLICKKPGNLAYAIFGFGKPKDKVNSPEY